MWMYQSPDPGDGADPVEREGEGRGAPPPVSINNSPSFSAVPPSVFPYYPQQIPVPSPWASAPLAPLPAVQVPSSTGSVSQESRRGPGSRTDGGYRNGPRGRSPVGCVSRRDAGWHWAPFSPCGRARRATSRRRTACGGPRRRRPSASAPQPHGPGGGRYPEAPASTERQASARPLDTRPPDSDTEDMEREAEEFRNRVDPEAQRDEQLEDFARRYAEEEAARRQPHPIDEELQLGQRARREPERQSNLRLVRTGRS